MTIRRFFSVAVASCLCIIALSVVTKADTITFTAVLSGANEKPNPVNTAATGTATLVLDDATGKATLTVNYSGLSAAMTGAHIHGPASPHNNASVLYGFNTLVTQTAGGTAGSLTNHVLTITLTAQQMADLKNGLWYVNVHSSNNPGGEIRGQLYAVPEPGTLLLLGAGLLSMAGVLKKRRE